MSDFDDNPVDINNAIVQSFILPEFSGKDITVDILRLDKIHPVVSGNKWFKLKYYLQEALEKKSVSIFTYGGAWSNHIIATAYMAKFHGLRSFGVIRGEQPERLSFTLQEARRYGMTLEFISRVSYSKKNTGELTATLRNKFHGAFFIPEGGAGLPGIMGSQEILSLADREKYTHIMCCVGTGTMFGGIVNASLPRQQVIGINVLKGIPYAADQFTNNQEKINACKIFDDFHFGGYAKKSTELIQFMNYCYEQTGIPTDFVYTAKLLFALVHLVSRNYFVPGSNILLIHSGGLQGNASLPRGTLIF